MEESKNNASDLVENKSIKSNQNEINYYNIKKNRKESINYSKDIYNLKSAINNNNSKFRAKINKIRDDIIKLKSKLSEIKVPFCKYTQKDLEQNLIKQKLLINTINLFKEEFDSNKENILLLEEENNICTSQLYNYISLKDNYEESIKDNTKYIFKNLMISLDQNNGQSISNNSIEENSPYFFFNEKNDIKVESYDINNLQNLPKFSNMIYKILSSHITSLMMEKNIKSLIFSSIEGIFYDFIENKINADGFVKTIANNISTSNDKIHNFIIIPRFELLLKYILKTFSLEKIINDLMKFINKDYSYNKKLLQKNQEEIKIKIQNLTKEKLEYNKAYSIIEKEYNNKLTILKRIEFIKNEIMKKEEEIRKEENKKKINEINQRKKLNRLENLNAMFDTHLNESDIQKTIQNIQKNINNLSNQIKIKKEEIMINSNNNLDSKELCNITDINNNRLYQNNYKDTKIKSDCYILIKNLSDNIEFDPIKDYDIKPETKGFNKSLIIFENNIINIIFNQIKDDINIKINYNSIKQIIINPVMKKIIHYMKKYNKEKNNIEIILKNEKEISSTELIKFIYNKYFCLSLILENGKVINIIFLTYENFKIWMKIFDKFHENYT